MQRKQTVQNLHAANMEERPCSLDEDVPIFRPSERDLREKSLVEYAEWCARSLRGADDEGDDAESNWAALKIVLPESFHPARKRIAKHGFDNIIDAARLPSPNAQRVLGSQGLYRLINEESRALSLKQFKVLADEAAMPKQHSRCTRGNGSAGDSAAVKLSVPSASFGRALPQPRKRLATNCLCTAPTLHSACSTVTMTREPPTARFRLAGT